MIAIFLNKGQNVDDVTGEELYTPLHVASKHGQLDIVEFLISNNANIHAEAGWEGKAIHLAAEYGHKDIIKLLLSKGLKVDETKSNNETPLHLSSTNGHIEATQFLIDNNADVYAETSEGRIAIHCAAESGYEGVIEIFLKGGMAIDEQDWNKCTSLHVASEHGHLTAVQYLLDKNANIHAKCSMNREPIHYGAQSHCIEVVEVLLDRGANINETDMKNLTPLHFASELSTLEMVKFLVNHDANVHAKCSKDRKPVLHAVWEGGNLDIIEFFLNHGVDVNEANMYGLTILHLAVEKYWFKLVRFLVDACSSEPDFSHSEIQNSVGFYHSIKHKIYLEAQDKEGYTALHLCGKYYWPDIMKYLLEAGAKSDVRDYYQRTALFYYLKNWRPTDTFTSEILKKISNYIDVENAEQKTAIHIVVKRPYGSECLEFVSQYQKDVNVEDVYGKTPLTYITEDPHIRGNEERKKLIRLLICKGAYFNANDCRRIIADPALKELLTDINLCSQSIINKFNNRDITLLHGLPLSVQLPSCHRMKASSAQVRMIKLAVAEEIRNEGHCDISRVPLSLAMLSVDAFIYRYSELGKMLRILARLN